MSVDVTQVPCLAAYPFKSIILESIYFYEKVGKISVAGWEVVDDHLEQPRC